MQFLAGENRESLGLTGLEEYTVTGIPEAVTTGSRARVWAKSDSGEKTFEVVVRIDTPQEAEYYRNGGILPYVVRQLAGKF
jgi:aconitate hydratase